MRIGDLVMIKAWRSPGDKKRSIGIIISKEKTKSWLSIDTTVYRVLWTGGVIDTQPAWNLRILK